MRDACEAMPMEHVGHSGSPGDRWAQHLQGKVTHTAASRADRAGDTVHPCVMDMALRGRELPNQVLLCSPKL